MSEPNWAWVSSLLKSLQGSIKLGDGIVGRSVYLLGILIAFGIIVFIFTKDIHVFYLTFTAFFIWYLMSILFSSKYPWLSILSGSQLKSFLEFQEQAKKEPKKTIPIVDGEIISTKPIDTTLTYDPSNPPGNDVATEEDER